MTIEVTAIRTWRHADLVSELQAAYADGWRLRDMTAHDRSVLIVLERESDEPDRMHAFVDELARAYVLGLSHGRSEREDLTD